MTRRNSLTVLCVCAWLLAMAGPTLAQDFRGRINGVASDNTGAVLPGVTVSVASPALIQSQVQVTGGDGTFRFIALPPGVYGVTFELAGFQTVKREGIRVVINQTLSVDQQMQVATLQETVTVTGASPVVDTTTTSMGTNFTKELLTEIPNARDVWAAMSQAPGIQMTGYDVGGSRTGTQTGYVTYGVDVQNQTRMEGIDTTEATSANAGYFDFGSFEEFQVGGAGNDAGSYASGASLSISVKSGGDRFSGNWYSDFENHNTVSDNVPDNLKTANTKDDNGFYVTKALTRGNPIDKQYDINFNLGGPLWKRKAWFFYSYRLNDQYKNVLGFSELQRSKLTNNYTLKGTFQLNQNNQVIGFMNKRNKLQDRRDFGPSVPLSAALYQASRNYPMKLEWTSVLGSKAFLDVLAGEWYNFFPLRPTREFDVYPTGSPWGPGRIETTTSTYFDGGANSSYQDQKRYKPQFYASLTYFKDGWAGSHDFKGGYDWKRDRRSFFQDQPFDIFYRDTNGLTNQVELYNSNTTPVNDVVYHSGWISDTWKFHPRLTFNIGGRLERYTDGWQDQSVAPNGHPMLAGWNDPTYQAFIAAKDVPARTVAQTMTFAPRAGVAYDLTGDNKTVLKTFFGRFYWNSADTLADQENPVAQARLRYAFNDLNGNRVLDGPQELGALNSTQGGGGFVRVDRALDRPHTDELSTSVEREIVGGLSGRASYVYKNMRNVWGEIDAIRTPAYVVPYTIVDRGADNVVGTADDKTFATTDRPATIPSDRVYTNPSINNADFNTFEVALNRRFSGKWMALTSFEYTWLNQINGATQTTIGPAGNGRSFQYRPAQLLFGENGRETVTIWNYKVIGRYVMPYAIGVSGSVRIQSGAQWGRTLSVPFPGDGTQTVRVEPVTAHRAPNVVIPDIRFDKKVRFGKAGSLTAMVDIFNLINAGTVTNFRNATGATYQEVTGILDPRVVRFGVRYDF